MIFFRASEAFSLGLERTGGFETVAFCEIEDYPRRVLAKHWPGVPCYDDVRTLTADALSRDGIAVDVICGGFPCQDISFAGKGAGLAGERSGLWREYARLIGELRPRYVIVENVAALLGRGLRDVLGDMATLGYDAEWHCIPAAAVGAPHRRDRLWIVAYARGEQHEGDCAPIGREIAAQLHAADAAGDRWQQRAKDGGGSREGVNQGEKCRSRRLCHDPLADAKHSGRERWHEEWSGAGTTLSCSWWLTEPDVGRVADGVPSRVDRLRGLGNAVVPQVPFIIGRAILRSEGLTPSLFASPPPLQEALPL